MQTIFKYRKPNIFQSIYISRTGQKKNKKNGHNKSKKDAKAVRDSA